MTQKTRLEAIHEDLASLGHQVVSLYIPRPRIEAGGDKWRILKKNAATALDAVEDDTAALTAALTDELNALENPDIRGNGIALFAAPGGVRLLHLTHRPRPVMKQRGTALMLPALADAISYGTRWIAVADLEHPRLLVADADSLHDMTAHLHHDSFDQIEGMRDVESEVLYHSAARGGAAAGASGTHFHSLGTDPVAEREKSEEDFYTGFARAVEAAVPPNVATLVLMGDPHRAGRCAAHFRRLNVTQAHVAGTGLTDARILAESRTLEPDGPQPADTGAEKIHGPAAVRKAAASGQVARILVPRASCGLETGLADEHTDIVRWVDEEAGSLAALDLAVADAVGRGAALDLIDGPVEGDIEAVLRW